MTGLKSVLKTAAFYFLMIFLVSCGLSSREKIDAAIANAHQLLTKKNCDEALNQLNQVDYQNNDPAYLSVYASALACKSDFDETGFFLNDVDNLQGAFTRLLPSLTTMSTSETSGSSDDNYQNLREAINTLLYAGGITGNPSHARRVEALGDSGARKLSTQALYMVIVQLGKYFYLYGSTDDDGNKGGRAATTNDCLADYLSVPGRALRLASVANISPCAADNNGHSELSATSPIRKRQMCEGIVLFNNFRDLVLTLSFRGRNVGGLPLLQQGLAAMNTACGNLGVAGLCTQRDLDDCVDNDASTDIEAFFVGLFEHMLTIP